MNRFILAFGASAAMVAVILGAFAAHGLKGQLSSEMLAVFQTGVQYQFYHALGLLAVGIIAKHLSSGLVIRAGQCFIAGIVLFSGSLYALALTSVKWLGPVTPIGGVCFIVGWLLLSIAIVKDSK